MFKRHGLLRELVGLIQTQDHIRLLHLEPTALPVSDDERRQVTGIAVGQLTRRQMELTYKSGDEHHEAVISRERGVDLSHDDLRRQMVLDGSAEKRDGSRHEHSRRKTLSADITDDEGHIIAVSVEIIQVASDTLHRHERSMQREPVIINEIMHQDTSLDIPCNLYLVLDELMLVLHLKIGLLVHLYPVEKQHKHHNTDNQHTERDYTSCLDALPNDGIRHGDHQLHVDRIQGLRIDPPMQFIALIEHLILLRTAVRRSDERTVRTVDQTYRFVIRVDVLQNIFDPFNREVVSHHADQPSLFVFYFDGMGSNPCLRAGTYIRLRPIPVTVASERTRIPVAHVVIQTVRAMRSTDRLTVKTVRTREIIALLALIDTRCKLNEDIVYMRIAIELRTGCLQ